MNVESDHTVRCPKLTPGCGSENFAEKFKNLLTVKGKGTTLSKRLKASPVKMEGAAAPTQEQQEKNENEDALVCALLAMNVDDAYAPILRQHCDVPHLQWAAKRSSRRNQSQQELRMRRHGQASG